MLRTVPSQTDGVQHVQVDRLIAGEVGYMAASIKAVADARVGDTITQRKGGCTQALPGYEEAKPMVFCGLFPIDADRYEDLREALGKLQLNDAALQYEPEVRSCFVLSVLRRSLCLGASRSSTTRRAAICPRGLRLSCAFITLHTSTAGAECDIAFAEALAG